MIAWPSANLRCTSRTWSAVIVILSGRATYIHLLSLSPMCALRSSNRSNRSICSFIRFIVLSPHLPISIRIYTIYVFFYVCCGNLLLSAVYDQLSAKFRVLLDQRCRLRDECHSCVYTGILVISIELIDIV